MIAKHFYRKRESSCPMCGSAGEILFAKPQKVFVCVNCFSAFSKYSVLLQTQEDAAEEMKWT